MVKAGEEITHHRRTYLDRLEPYIARHVEQLVDLDKLSLSFACGWRQDLSFLEALQASLPQDREYGFTRQGPHRADIILKVGNRPARDAISRGQQKLLVIAMLLAQVALLNATSTLRPVILVDDLTAELDIYHRQRLLSVLAELKAQVILTVTDRQALPIDRDIPIQWFHVEQGKIMPV